MSRNGSGVYSPPVNSWNPAVSGNAATPTDWQSILNDLAAALTQSLSADGQTQLTGNLNANGNKLTNLAVGTATGNTLAYQQLFSQGTEQAIASAGTVDIGGQNTNFLRVTGTTSITSFGTNYNGPRFLRFAGACTLTNSATLVLPGGVNMTTAGGETFVATPIGNPSAGWAVSAVNPWKYSGANLYYNAGNVSIGTTSASARLDVVGGTGIRVNEDGAGTKAITLRSDFAGVGPAVNVSTNHPLLLMTNNTVQGQLSASGSLLLTNATGGIGYGIGAGGTVTQATSKTTSVTLNKPTGKITMNAASLAAGATAVFTFNNSTIGNGDSLVLSFDNAATWAGIASYSVRHAAGSGAAIVALKNESAGALAQAVILNFEVFKGATS